MTAQLSMPSMEAVGFLAREAAPLLFDPVAVGTDGFIVRTVRDRLSFAFEFQGATFSAEGHREGEEFAVAIDANLGPLPFSAECAAARRGIQALVATSADAHGPQMTIGDDQTIRISGRFVVARPVSPLAVMTALTEFLLGLKPWLAQLGALLATSSLRAGRSG